MDLQLYLKNVNNGDYVQLDLFQDEKVQINLVAKELSDISKIRSDFTQPFTIPTSPTNNVLLQHWYDADVDGTFNANIRVDAYIEINSIPFKYGSIQLDNCKLKKGIANSYSITFFGSGVNLSDKFGDDLLSALPLSLYDHNYNQTVVLNSIGNPSINNGDIYYPLINAFTYMDLGTNSTYDLAFVGNTISYRDFKPAIRDVRIIEAIERKYGVFFSRDFIDRSVFYNKFTWLHKESGRLKTSSDALILDINTLVSTISTPSSSVWTSVPLPYNLSSNEIYVKWRNFPNAVLQSSRYKRIRINLQVITTSNNLYRVDLYEGDKIYDSFTDITGTNNITIYDKKNNEDNSNRIFKIKISSIEGIVTFSSKLRIEYISALSGYDREINLTSSSQTTSNSVLKIHEQMPEMKVKEYFNSLISQFNLIIIPTGFNSYFIDTLDNWYSKGKAYDISNLVDIKDVTVKRPNVKKRIDFLYQKSTTVLANKYFENNQLSYGDLKAVFNITGEDLKIESQFENMLFERLQDSTTGVLSDIQCGFSVDLQNNPVKGKAISFYRNGIENSIPININGFTLNKVWHTATEDNKTFDQVTSSLNFGADNSSYFYAPIDTSLYYNFWKTYIEELYNKKTRVLTYKCKLPIRILQKLGLNDRFIIGDYKYKISTAKVDLTSSDADIEIFSDLGQPLDSVENVDPLTVDSTMYTVDNDNITVDTVSTYNPITSYTLNGISLTTYISTKGEEHFELKISAKSNWNLSISNLWITTNKTNGKKSDYVRVTLSSNFGSTRTGTITVNIGTDIFNLTITQ